MYDKKLKRWISDCDTLEKKSLIKNPEKAEDPEVLFLKTSELLTEINITENLVRAVADMEVLANNKYVPAIFAMGQMFEYGWGVHKNRKTALQWYQKAAKEGYEPAVRIIEAVKKAKKKRVVTSIVSVSVAVLIAVVVSVIILNAKGGPKIKVDDDTELEKVTSIDELNEAASDIFKEYDNESVIKNEASTNRILVRFEGDELDLSDFKADKVISQSNNMLIIQFSDEEEANRCLQYLNSLENVVFAQMDSYDNASDEVGEKYCTLTQMDFSVPTDKYLSWGVPDMGLDKLSEYVRENYSDNDVLVAVIDSGARIHSAYADRCFEGYNTVTGGDVVYDVHGTHVMGTVLDGADCDNIKVINFDVFNGEATASDLSITLAIYCAIDAGADVINMSLGGSSCAPAESAAIQDAVDAGISVVVASGNSGADATTTPHCPAHHEIAITVGAYDIEHEIASFSNYGDCVDVCAPGVAVWSLSHIMDNAIVPLKGTSMASPHIAALAALIKAIFPDVSPAEVESMIRNSCRTFTNPEDYGTGVNGYGAPDATVFIEGFENFGKSKPVNRPQTDTKAVFPDFYDFVEHEYMCDTEAENNVITLYFYPDTFEEAENLVVDYAIYASEEYDFDLVDATDSWVGLKYTGREKVQNYASEFYNGPEDNSNSMDLAVSQITTDSGEVFNVILFRFSADLRPVAPK